MSLVIDIRASPNVTIIHKTLNYNLFAIILLFSNVSLPYSPSTCESSRPPV